jgi:hypothetical protein
LSVILFAGSLIAYVVMYSRHARLVTADAKSIS